MNDNAAEVLKHIADKLDVPVQQLWAGLVAYAPFTYYQWLAMVVVAAMLFVVLGSISRTLLIKAVHAERDAELYGIPGVIFGIIAALAFCVLIFDGVGGMAQALAAKHAPEAWASKYILQKIGR